MGINLEESSTYRLVIEEGRRRGELDRARKIIVRLGGNKFGSPSPTVVTTVQGVSDLDRLDRMTDRLATATDWDDLLATP